MKIATAVAVAIGVEGIKLGLVICGGDAVPSWAWIYS
jgi:hypothetical protein